MNTQCRWTGLLLVGTALSFWMSWVLMPGVGITDAAQILTLVGRQPRLVLASSVLQLLSAALLGMAIPGLAGLFATRDRWGRLAVTFLAVGAAGDAADAVYHQLAYEMVQPGVDQAAMLPVMQRMQTADLLYLLPLIAAFLLGCIALSVSAARLHLVSPVNPMLYALCPIIAPVGVSTAAVLHLPIRVVGLACLGLLSASLAWIGAALHRSGHASFSAASARAQHSALFEQRRNA